MKLSGVGTTVGKRIHCMVFSFTILDEVDSVSSVDRIHPIAIFRKMGSYDSLPLALADVAKGVAELTHHHHHRPGPTLHNAAITATCVRAHEFLTNPYASCSDCCIVQCWSWSVVVVVVECCCCIPYRLALMLVLTFAPSVLTFAPCTLTFAPCACGVIFLSTSASTPLSHMVVVTGCNLRLWRFSFSHWRKHSLHWWW